MSDNYYQSVKVKSSSQNAFNALTNQVESWWGSVDNPVAKVGDHFTITFGEAYWKFEITEWNENEKVTWRVVDGQPELNNEWIGHILEWKIIDLGNEIEVSLYQNGLTDELPCFDVCSAAWDRFILSSLKKYLETGLGEPALV